MIAAGAPAGDLSGAFGLLYQAGFIEQRELLRRGKELDARRRALETQREALIAERGELAQKNRLRLRQRIADCAEMSAGGAFLRILVDAFRC
jgi:hypothetical protein